MIKNPQDTWILIDKLKDSEFKDFEFISWETGLSSTERRNLSRVRKVLDLLDELNKNNLKKGEYLFYFCSQLIKELLSKRYDINGNDRNTYTITRLKK